jgi:hypothetical protein
MGRRTDGIGHFTRVTSGLAFSTTYVASSLAVTLPGRVDRSARDEVVQKAVSRLRDNLWHATQPETEKK